MTVHRSEQRPLDDGNELVRLILEHTLVASAAGANELQANNATPRPADTPGHAEPAQYVQNWDTRL
jgi:hypothetical protein